eukprot:1195371-Prorocentrum_minimum.AAC.6
MSAPVPAVVVRLHEVVRRCRLERAGRVQRARQLGLRQLSRQLEPGRVRRKQGDVGVLRGHVRARRLPSA